MNADFSKLCQEVCLVDVGNVLAVDPVEDGRVGYAAGIGCLCRSTDALDGKANCILCFEHLFFLLF